MGTGYGPTDNNNERVKETRELMDRYYSYVPYGMWVGNKNGDEMKPLVEEDSFYNVDVSWWPVGAYRFNIHTKAGEQAPFGSELHLENRDQDCSWAKLESLENELVDFLHKEENGAGFSIRILIRPDRSIEAFGDVK